jgi:hypothetical protein
MKLSLGSPSQDRRVDLDGHLAIAHRIGGLRDNEGLAALEDQHDVLVDVGSWPLILRRLTRGRRSGRDILGGAREVLDGARQPNLSI